VHLHTLIKVDILFLIGLIL